jgi:hypothetical protein
MSSDGSDSLENIDLTVLDDLFDASVCRAINTATAPTISGKINRNDK